MSNSVTELKLSGKVIGLVDVPEGVTVLMGAACPACLAQGVFNCGYFDECGNHHPALKLHRGDEFVESISLSPGQWSIVGMGDKVTEEQWRGIIPECQYPFKEGYLYLDYEGFKRTGDRQYYDDPMSSGLSLLASYGKKPETCLIIIKND